MPLRDQIVAVAGGSGTVGSGIVFRLLEAGATVIVPCRTESSRDAMLQDLSLEDHSFSGEVEDVLRTPIANVAKDGALILREYIEQNFPDGIDHVFSSLGGWWEKGSLLEVGVDGIKEVLATGAFPHILVYQALFPLLKKSNKSSYTFITGGLAQGIPERPSMGPLCISAATTSAIARAAMADARETDIRVNALHIKLYVQRHTMEGRKHASNRLVGVAALNIADSNAMEQTFDIKEESDFLKVARDQRFSLVTKGG